MSSHTSSHQSSSKKSLIRVFWILLIVTIIEVAWGLTISYSLPKWFNSLFFLSLTMVKAGYIVAEFMHLKYELKSLISSILLPLLLFIWLILAFCFDGSAWLGLREEYNAERPSSVTEQENPKHSLPANH